MVLALNNEKTVYHPNGTHICVFNETYHTYIDNRNKRYTSATTLVNPFFPKFDASAMSRKCSTGTNPKYTGRDPVEIQNEWRTEGRRSSKEGDNAHAYAETLISGFHVSKQPAPISLRCAYFFWQIRRAVRWLTTDMGLIFIGAETIVFSPGLGINNGGGIAGMIDLLMYCPKSNVMFIIDWKTNKEVTRVNTFSNGKALEPIDHLRDTHIVKYSLQLSLYQRIMEIEKYFPGVDGFKRMLIHLSVDKFEPIWLEYYDYEIELMLGCNK